MRLPKSGRLGFPRSSNSGLLSHTFLLSVALLLLLASLPPLHVGSFVTEATPISSVGPSLPATRSEPSMVAPRVSGSIEVGAIQVGQAPNSGLLQPLSGIAYFSNGGSSNVSAVRDAAALTSIEVGSNPGSSAFDPASGLVYVPNALSDNVSVINGTLVVATVSVGVDPVEAAYDPVDGYIYIVNEGDASNQPGTVSVINGTALVATIAVGLYPTQVIVNPSSGQVYILNRGYGGPGEEGNITVITGESATVSISLGPLALLGSGIYDSFNGYLYVPGSCADYCSYSDNVSVINGTSVVTSIPFGPRTSPSVLAFDHSSGEVYVAYGGAAAAVIDGTSVIAQFGSGLDPQPGTFDARNGFTYIPNSGSDNVTVINRTTIVATLPVGGQPVAALYDPSNGFVYVANRLSDNVSILNGSFYYTTLASFAASPSVVDVGVPTSLTAQASGGLGPLSYAYTGLPSGCSTLNSSGVRCTPLVAGAYDLKVFVNDSAGNSVSRNTTLSVVPVVATTLNVSSYQVDVGVSARFGANPSGGAGPFSFSWVFGDGGRSNLQYPSHAYSSRGNFSVKAWVNDTGGGSASSSLDMTVYPALIATLAVSNSTPALGQSVEFNATGSGGLSPYSFYYGGLPPGCVSVDSPTIGCLPTQAGFYNVSVTVSDGSGGEAGATVAMRVIFDFTLVAPSQTTVGEPLTLHVLFPGTESGVTYAYSGLPPGCLSSDAPTLTCTPDRVGTYTVSATVENTAGDRATHAAVVNVVPWSVSLLTSPFVLGGIGLALIAGVGTAIYLVRGRRGRPATDPYSDYHSSVHGRGRSGPSNLQRPGRLANAPSSSSVESSEEDDSFADLI
jgi:DNA-binding beta-propeller fold protein YncE